ncbi:MAG: hypothetical protein AAFR67_18065, partial [Chloroflexota bacterium]
MAQGQRSVGIFIFGLLLFGFLSVGVIGSRLSADSFYDFCDTEDENPLYSAIVAHSNRWLQEFPAHRNHLTPAHDNHYRITLSDTLIFDSYMQYNTTTGIRDNLWIRTVRGTSTTGNAGLIINLSTHINIGTYNGYHISHLHGN